MKRILSIITLLALNQFVFAQDKTYETHDDRGYMFNKTKPSVLVITFDNRMYRSDVDRELGKHNELSQAQIQRLFQNAVPSVISQKFSNEYNVMDLAEYDEDSLQQMLSFIHQNLTYKYEVMKKDESKFKAIKSSNKKPSNNGLSEGEIKVETTSQEKYMNAYIKNDTLLSYLKNIYEFDYLILVNEFDLTYHVQNPDLVAYGGVQKQVKTHYSIYGTDGKMLDSGAENGYLDNGENNIYQIIQTSIPQVADKILLSFKEAIGTEKD